MKKIIVSAPGKIILSGEHAVVYGKPALVAAVSSKRLYATLQVQSSKFKVQSVISNIKKTNQYLAKIIHVFEEKNKVSVDKNLSLVIDSQIPVKVGMGSSASLAVATVGALQIWFGKPWNPQEINELAYEAEKSQHGNSSGIDPTIVTHGGLLWYRKELEYLKTFWLLPYKLPKTFAPIVVINTGRSETTGDLVTGVVGRMADKDPDGFNLLLSEVEKATRALAAAIHDEDEVSFRRTMTRNEFLLERMGVVSRETQKLVREIESCGGAAKISGAGGVKTGSGIVMAIADKPQKLVDIAKKYHYPVFLVTLGGEGVRREQVIV